MLLISFSICGTVIPVAYAAPMIDPMLVPAITSTGTRSSSRTLRYTDMRSAACAAAGQDKTDLRPRRLCSGRVAARSRGRDWACVPQHTTVDKQAMRQTATFRIFMFMPDQIISCFVEIVAKSRPHTHTHRHSLTAHDSGR